MLKRKKNRLFLIRPYGKRRRRVFEAIRTAYAYAKVIDSFGFAVRVASHSASRPTDRRAASRRSKSPPRSKRTNKHWVGYIETETTTRGERRLSDEIENGIE